jgi:hypothetical protein
MLLRITEPVVRRGWRVATVPNSAQETEAYGLAKVSIPQAVGECVGSSEVATVGLGD